MSDDRVKQELSKIMDEPGRRQSAKKVHDAFALVAKAINKKKDEKLWWQDDSPIHEEGDGQEVRKTYSRQRSNDEWEYVTVITYDDGTLIKTLTFRSGNVYVT